MNGKIAGTILVALLVGIEARSDTVTIVANGKEITYHCSSKAAGVTCEPVGKICGGDLKNKDCWDAVVSVAFPQEPAFSIHLMQLAGCWNPSMLEVVRALNDKAHSGVSIPTLRREVADAYNCCALVATRYSPAFSGRRKANMPDGTQVILGERSGMSIALVQPGPDLKCVMPAPHPFDRYAECVKKSSSMARYKTYRFHFADFVITETGKESWSSVDVACGTEKLKCTANPKRAAVTCSMAAWPDKDPTKANGD
jgi:hypothetical protein